MPADIDPSKGFEQIDGKEKDAPKRRKSNNILNVRQNKETFITERFIT